MLKNQLIIIPIFLPKGFPADFEEQTAKFLSNKNKVIILRLWQGTTIFKLLTNKKKFSQFTKKVKTLNKNLVYFPIIHLLPFQRVSLIAKINYQLVYFQIKLISKLIGKKPILWIFYPNFKNLVGKLGEKLAIYDCVDFHSSPHPKIDKNKKNKEKKLLKKVDIVFTISPVLKKIKAKFHPKVFSVPQGVTNTNLFLKTPKSLLPEEFKKIPAPRIVFTGNINHRLDFKLIKKLTSNNPSWSFIFIGSSLLDNNLEKTIPIKKTLEKLKQKKNIYFITQKNKKELIGFLDHLDIGIIPYNMKNEAARFCHPMKTFEFFARGKPLISTPIEALKPLKPFIKIANNAKAFEKEIKIILKNGWPEKYKRKQKKITLDNSPNNKFKKIDQILKKEFPYKFND